MTAKVIQLSFTLTSSRVTPSCVSRVELLKHKNSIVHFTFQIITGQGISDLTDEHEHS